MLSDLLAALVEPSPRTRDAVGNDALAAFLAQPITEQLRAIVIFRNTILPVASGARRRACAQWHVSHKSCADRLPDRG